MKIIRYRNAEGRIGHGALREDGAVHVITGDIFGDYAVTGEQALALKVLTPVVPPAILCIGLNYRRHAAETGVKIPEQPVLFMKSPGALQNPGDPIEIPTRLRSDMVDYEGELAVVIGKACKNAPRHRALEYVLGYSCANDVSARDWQLQRGGGQWCRGKTFDTFAPLGPCLATPDEIPDPNGLAIKTILNGETVQDWSTGDMIFDVPALIEFLSGSTTLLPGTVIMTGTPHGVGMARSPALWLKAGDSVSVEIEGIGVLTNPVVDEA